MGAGNGSLVVQRNATASGTAEFDMVACSYLRVDIAVSAFTGGTTPDVTFAVDQLAADGTTWVQLQAGAAITAAGAQAANIGPDVVGTGAANAVLTGRGRLRWTFGGAVVATSITFVASVYGRA